MPHASAIDYANASLNELATLARSGQREAFRHIIQRCNQRLFRVARAVLNDDNEAEDALQETYANAFRHIDQFRGEAELSTWLTRIALNECHRRLRARHPTVDIDTIEAIEETATILPFPPRFGMEDPANIAARGQYRGLIEHAVAALPEPFRLVFMLRDVEECSVEETAHALDIRPETVKTRLFRARRLLREALSEQLTASLGEAFPFLGTRCARLTDAVMARIGNSHPSTTGEH
ncbi:MAG TPA: RNA polymerase sigma factor [Rhodanobacteraceae bacterium]|nr:RNA polymerase sigma factor [Rhodanobacteraceae bacterium]